MQYAKNAMCRHLSERAPLSCPEGVQSGERIGREPVQKPGRSKQDYGTPWEFIRAVEMRFGPLACDLAASRESAKAAEFIAAENDSLSVAWSERWPDGMLWLNPPFANIDPWAEKCAFESLLRRDLILFLTPASIGSNWFSNHVNRKAVVFGLSPRLTFEGTSDPYPKDLMLSVFGMGLSGFDTWRWKP